jgi:hypothetical protein
MAKSPLKKKGPAHKKSTKVKQKRVFDQGQAPGRKKIAGPAHAISQNWITESYAI